MLGTMKKDFDEVTVYLQYNSFNGSLYFDVANTTLEKLGYTEKGTSLMDLFIKQLTLDGLYSLGDEDSSYITEVSNSTETISLNGTLSVLTLLGLYGYEKHLELIKDGSVRWVFFKKTYKRTDFKEAIGTENNEKSTIKCKGANPTIYV